MNFRELKSYIDTLPDNLLDKEVDMIVDMDRYKATLAVSVDEQDAYITFDHTVEA